jgi:hypothetical protein
MPVCEIHPIAYLDSVIALSLYQSIAYNNPLLIQCVSLVYSGMDIAYHTVAYGFMLVCAHSRAIDG